MEKTISVIIPTYNMEAYLAKCLSSLIIGKGQGRVEAVVVNDGSTDSSLSIARDFERRYPETFRIVDKANGNYGSCVNAALKVATGRYVKILDADDTFDTEAFTELVDLLDRIDVDLILNDKAEVRGDGETVNRLRYDAGRIDDFFGVSDIRNFRYITMHDVTYRLSIVKDMGYVQTEGIFYTDMEWAFAPMAYVQTAWYFDRPLYRYLLGREGQTMDSRVIDLHLKDEILATMKNVNSWTGFAGRPANVVDLLHEKLYRQIRRLYKRVIIKSPYLDGDVLALLDDELRMKDSVMYARIGRETKYGLRYVSIWRKNRQSLLLKLIIKAFRCFE